MAEFFNIRSETIAFILGFLSATLFWWILGRIRPLLPRLRARLVTAWQNIRRKTHDRIDIALRQEALRHAQAMHLAAPLFPLDEILIPPALMVPPPSFSNLTNPKPETIIEQTIPYLPDWPELTAQFGLPSLSPAHSLENNARIIVIGQPGSGKTVALAHLAAQLARKDPAAGSLSSALPIFLHVLDLQFEPVSVDPLDVITRALQAQSPRLIQSRIPRTLRFMVNAGLVVLLLDGIDELPAQAQSVVSAFLTGLCDKYPSLKVMVTGSPDHLDGLLACGFQPLALRSWNAQHVSEHIHRWSKVWQVQVAPRLAKEASSPQPVDERILSSWLHTEQNYLTPLEWTLRIWGLHAGDVRGASTNCAVESYLRRLVHDSIPMADMAALAREFLVQNTAALSFQHLDNVLSKIKIAEPAAASGVDKTAPKSRKISGRSRILSILLDSGIMVEHAGEQIRFAHPVFTGMLAALSPDPALIAVLPVSPYWSTADETCHFLAAQNQAADILRKLLPLDDDPLYSGLLRAARWLKDAPSTAEWRAGILRRLVSLAQRDNLSTSLRARFLTAILSTNDTATPLLLKQLASNESPIMRQLAALVIGAYGSEKFLDELITLTNDSQPEVRHAALVAISSCESPRAIEFENNILISGEEWMQLAAAELHAYKGSAGYESLRGALATDNLLARRAAVAGLARIRERWADDLLEKVAVEDAQWVVRSAAGQVIEERRTSPDPNIPSPLPRPVNAPWLINFASKQGMGIPPDKPPTDLLLQAVKTGSQQEKLGALTYLRNQPDDIVITAIYSLIREQPGILREAAMYSLWHIASSGNTLPPLSSPGAD